MKYNVLALDLSLTNTGLAVINSNCKVKRLRSIKTVPADGAPVVRMDYIAEIIGTDVKRYNPHLIVIEEYAFSKAGSKLGELGGIVKRKLWKVTGVPECWMTVVGSTWLKGVTGSGGGTTAERKARSLDFARPFFLEAGVTEEDAMWKDDNVADALNLARHGLMTFDVS